jgi:hypothetical protein
MYIVVGDAVMSGVSPAPPSPVDPGGLVLLRPDESQPATTAKERDKRKKTRVE